MNFALLLIVVTGAVCFVVAILGAVELVNRLLGRGEVADVANEETRARIDGDGPVDTPLPVAEAARINAAFAGLINSDLRAELRRVDEDLARFYVIGEDR